MEISWKKRKRKKVRIKVLCHPATPLLGIYPEKTAVLKDICAPMFIAALFAIAGAWKWFRYPLADEQLKKSGTYIQWNMVLP